MSDTRNVTCYTRCAVVLYRGNDFRPQYKQSVKLQSVFDCPRVALSATFTQEIFDDIMGAQQLQEAAVTAGLPDRPNIFINVISKGCLMLEMDLLWLLTRVSTEQQSMLQNTLFFADRICVVTDLYSHMMVFLGNRAFSKGVVSMYHAHIAEPLAAQAQSFRVLQTGFAHPSCRLYDCFRHGDEIEGLKQVIHWGKAVSVLQEVGRCGQDGSQCTAVLYVKSATNLSST